MGSEPLWRKALNEFIARMHDLYGARLDRVVLYGSRARNSAEESSDIDILVIMKSMDNFWEEFHQISSVAGDLSLKYDLVLSAIPSDALDYDYDRTPFLMNVRKEGVQVG